MLIMYKEKIVSKNFINSLNHQMLSGIFIKVDICPPTAPPIIPDNNKGIASLLVIPLTNSEASNPYKSQTAKSDTSVQIAPMFIL